MSEPKLSDYTRVTTILNIFQNFGNVKRETLLKAMERGTVVHQAIDSHYQGKFTVVPPRFLPFYQSFMVWNEELKPSVVELEKRFFSKDWDVPVTGQVDLIAYIGEELYLIDFKTGSMPKEKIWELQLTFYHKLIVDSGMEYIPTKGMIVQLKPDGSAPDIFVLEDFLSLYADCDYCLRCYEYFSKPANLSIVSK